MEVGSWERQDSWLPWFLDKGPRCAGRALQTWLGTKRASNTQQAIPHLGSGRGHREGVSAVIKHAVFGWPWEEMWRNVLPLCRANASRVKNTAVQSRLRRHSNDGTLGNSESCNS